MHVDEGQTKSCSWGELIWAMPESKHSFLWEIVPYAILHSLVAPSCILSSHRLGVRNNCASGLSDDEPLYDSVASDDDYYTIQVHGQDNQLPFVLTVSCYC